MHVVTALLVFMLEQLLIAGVLPARWKRDVSSARQRLPGSRAQLAVAWAIFLSLVSSGLPVI